MSHEGPEETRPPKVDTAIEALHNGDPNARALLGIYGTHGNTVARRNKIIRIIDGAKEQAEGIVDDAIKHAEDPNIAIGSAEDYNPKDHIETSNQIMAKYLFHKRTEKWKKRDDL